MPLFTYFDKDPDEKSSKMLNLLLFTFSSQRVGIPVPTVDRVLAVATASTRSTVQESLSDSRGYKKRTII